MCDLACPKLCRYCIHKLISISLVQARTTDLVEHGYGGIVKMSIHSLELF